jgi:hypothetical protein
MNRTPLETRRADSATQQPPDSFAASSARRTGPVGAWALLGALSVAVTAQTWGRWIVSDQLRAAPIIPGSHYATSSEVALRIIEGVSVLVLLALLAYAFLVPLRRDRRLGLDARIMTGCVLGVVVDGVLNMHQYLFAWNAHSINLGSWESFLPLATAHTRYAESLLWGAPMYAYFPFGVALAGCAVVRLLRSRRPQITNVQACAVVFVLAFVFDLVVENGIIRLSDAYMYAKAPAALTLWAGSKYQFPIYESVFVAALGAVFTALRISAADAPDGISFVERGISRFRATLQEPVRWLAVIGFTFAMLFMLYHLPFNWLGVTGHSVAHLPSYMLAGR